MMHVHKLVNAVNVNLLLYDLWPFDPLYSLLMMPDSWWALSTQTLARSFQRRPTLRIVASTLRDTRKEPSITSGWVDASVTLPQILKQNPGFSLCCNPNYIPLGQSGIPWILQVNQWISKFHFLFLLTVLITLQSIGEDEYGKTGHSKIFTFWGTSWSFWRAIFLGLQYYTISQTLITCRAMHLRFNIVERCL